MSKTYDREVIALLLAASCEFVRRVKGSHEIWHSPITGRHFVVPHGMVKRTTANGVLKDAGLPKAF